MEQTLPEYGFFEKVLDKSKKSVIIALVPAGVAHPVERHLAKVEVASSSLVTRSITVPIANGFRKGNNP